MAALMSHVMRAVRGIAVMKTMARTEQFHDRLPPRYLRAITPIEEAFNAPIVRYGWLFRPTLFQDSPRRRAIQSPFNSGDEDDSGRL